MARSLPFAALALALAACAPSSEVPVAGDHTSADSDPVTGTFNRDRIIEDTAMLDVGAMSAAQVDAFLANPYPDYDTLPSCLASLSLDGKTTGTLIVDAARTYGINPLFLLTHLQKESSLVGNGDETCPEGALERAFGCGCPDGGDCDPAYAGFAAQLDCAASLTRSYLDDLANSGATISGWSVGGTQGTSDGYDVTPRNRATAVLYTYTPWVGDQDSDGNVAPFGNYLFWKNWTRYAATVGYTSSGSSSSSSSSSSGGAPSKAPLGSACSTDADCNGGLSGQEAVCGESSHVCITGCHADSDCSGTKVCDQGQVPWRCATPSAPANPIGSSITGNYSPSAAVAYADAHWDDGKGLCDEFVSDAAIVAGHLGLPYSTWVPDTYQALTAAGVPYDEYSPYQTSVRGCPGDIVIDSNDVGSSFCAADGGEKNCGHIGLVVGGGDSVDTILADFHNSAHYHLPIGDVLGTTDMGTYVSAYSTLRIYHLVNCAYY
jgi:hypothetical protein